MDKPAHNETAARAIATSITRDEHSDRWECAYAGALAGMAEARMTVRDHFACHAPEPHWRFMQDSKPKPYAPGMGEPWSDEDCNASYEAEAAWELARDVAWRFHWSEAMMAARGVGA